MTSGKPVDAPDERVLDRLAHASGEGQELGGRQLLVAEEDDLVLQKSLSNFLFGKSFREVDCRGPLRRARLRASDFHGP